MRASIFTTGKGVNIARHWVVLTVDRSPNAANTIISFTSWDGYTAAADEVVYTNPVDMDGNAVDNAWKVSGSVTLAAGVYTYTDPSTEPTLVDRQRSQIFEAYKYWRIFGRTSHWEGLRRDFMHEVNNVVVDTRTYPLDSTDKWAFHIPALVDHAIKGTFPISGAYTPAELQAFIDHADNVLRTLGPTWYLAQISPMKGPTDQAVLYANTGIADGDAIYTDIVTALGVLRTITGAFDSMVVTIPAGYNPESRTLGN